MPAVIVTREPFYKRENTGADVEAERDGRIKAGAIRSTIEEREEYWLLITEWNKLGENDN